AVTLDQFGNGSNTSPTTSGNLNFTWSNGNFGMGYPNYSLSSVNSVVSETIIPAVNSYPLGLGAEFTASVSPNTQILDVYVQGFNSVMTITASLSGGLSTSVNVTPTVNPPSDPSNYYAFGVYQIIYSGSASETLTVSVQTALNQPSNPPWAGASQAAFPNAGIFAATVSAAPFTAAPEPASAVMLALGSLLGIGFIRRRRC
ncbi:MAG TPA: PEP-CTERM sorting domain-containing protein, partial [Gemmataceae bacterium]|nr:PEP-CTERM sorting domain-containing protein [Gemmataceae bacterium]